MPTWNKVISSAAFELAEYFQVNTRPVFLLTYPHSIVCLSEHRTKIEAASASDFTSIIFFP